MHSSSLLGETQLPCIASLLMHGNSYPTAYPQILPRKVGKSLTLCLCLGQSQKRHVTCTRHANLAKSEVTEAAILGLPVQNVNMSLIKNIQIFSTWPKTDGTVVELGSAFSQYSNLSLSSIFQSQPSELDVVSKSLRTFRQSKLTNQVGSIHPPVPGQSSETRTETETQRLPWVRGCLQLWGPHITSLFILWWSWNLLQVWNMMCITQF